MDAQETIAPANKAYTIHLNNIAQTLGQSIAGAPVNDKVYLTDDVTMANGCVRVYSGLRDKMTDNEIQGVLGHELGHVHWVTAKMQSKLPIRLNGFAALSAHPQRVSSPHYHNPN